MDVSQQPNTSIYRSMYFSAIHFSAGRQNTDTEVMDLQYKYLGMLLRLNGIHRGIKVLAKKGNVLFQIRRKKMDFIGCVQENIDMTQ